MAIPEATREDILDVVGALLAINRALSLIRESLPPDARAKISPEMGLIIERCSNLLIRMDNPSMKGSA